MPTVGAFHFEENRYKTLSKAKDVPLHARKALGGKV
jgi:hypothetical protein